MSPEVAILIVKALIDHGPEMYFAVRSILTKTTVTEADFKAIDDLLAKSGQDYFKK